MRFFLGSSGPSLKGAVLGFVALGSVSCGDGGVQPGEYRVYRVAVGEGVLSKSCYPDAKKPADLAKDTSSLRSPATMAIWSSAENAYVLEIGGLSLEGTRSNDTYSFVGKTVDVGYAAPDGSGAKTTTTDSVDVEFTLRDKSVTGEIVTRRSVKCTNSPACPKATSCSSTADFVGTQIEEPEVGVTVPPVTEAPGASGAGGAPGPSVASASSSSSVASSVASSSSSSSSSGVGSSTTGPCESCYTAAFVGTSSPLCPSSQALYDSLVSCICSGGCSSSCAGDQICGGSNPTSSVCGDCVNSACGSQLAACSEDF